MRTWGFAFTEAALKFLEKVPHKERRQVIKKARALHANPFPQGCKKLQVFETDGGESIYRERSGDYRILYIVREQEVIILDIDHRKDVYKMPSTNAGPPDEMRMSEEEFDAQMRKALGVPLPSAAPSDGDKSQSAASKSAKTPRKQAS
jgi:mRNA interferase RelE/StbE